MNKLTEQELNELHHDVYHATRNLWKVLVAHNKLSTKEGAFHFFEGAWSAHDSLVHLSEYLECGILTQSSPIGNDDSGRSEVDSEARHWDNVATYNERHAYDNDEFDYED